MFAESATVGVPTPSSIWMPTPSSIWTTPHREETVTAPFGNRDDARDRTAGDSRCRLRAAAPGCFRGSGSQGASSPGETAQTRVLGRSSGRLQGSPPLPSRRCPANGLGRVAYRTCAVDGELLLCGVLVVGAVAELTMVSVSPPSSYSGASSSERLRRKTRR